MNTLETFLIQQKRMFDKKKVWIIQGDETVSQEAEAIIADLILDKMKVKQLVSWTLESGAKAISLVILQKKENYEELNEIIKNFQENGLDLQYMREKSEKDGNVYVRMDFFKMW